MRNGPDIARVAALLGDPGRANILTALLDGSTLTAGELARQAGVSAPTASTHLARLEQGGLLVRQRQGRHSYFRLAHPEIGQLLEGMMGLAERIGHRRTRTGPKEPALRLARICYDHLAGELGVAMLDALVRDGRLAPVDGQLRLTEAGERFVADFDISLADLRRSRRAVCRACLDWSERRHHLAGSLGAALLQRFQTLGWASREAGSRVIRFSPAGRAEFAATFRLTG
ncbi:MAG TPA: winged helix-turn-helix domain-containing protein [Geminicoccus sp.]|uniref:ArsR/SmtB family transcription factor n=1 Tax=Geminicoccus sp. TaxID=2024832 RepID=UPI002C69287E|nr:winged helix-turn-helix domain-containing protein [Geminicoccus sp.]HWL69908.1 winged helix-turn-helix domain-containing protein [Geminicoccus sp.]